MQHLRPAAIEGVKMDDLGSKASYIVVASQGADFQSPMLSRELCPCNSLKRLSILRGQYKPPV